MPSLPDFARYKSVPFIQPTTSSGRLNEGNRIVLEATNKKNLNVIPIFLR